MMNKGEKILEVTEPGEYEAGQAVELLIHSQTDLGFKAIVNSKHWGVIFYQEVFQPLSVGQRLPAFIKRVREDGKLDLILYRDGNKDSAEIGEKILAQLQEAGGFLPITEKTDPEEIYSRFMVSKKKFKIALSGLYKQRLIAIEDKGLRLMLKKK